MANTKEIQKRMKSIQDTMKITSAMYMISSAKLKKCKAEARKYRALFLCVTVCNFDDCSVIFRMLRSRYFDQHEEIPDDEKTQGIYCDHCR